MGDRPKSDHHQKNGLVHHQPSFTKQTEELINEVVVSLVMEDRRILKLECEGSEEIYKALVGACKEFIILHDGELKVSVEKLDMSDVKVCETFHETVQSIFEKEINWGRIVSALCVSRTMALKALNENRVGLVESIIGWLQRIVLDNLQDWILKHGGWVSHHISIFLLHCTVLLIISSHILACS